MDGHALSCSLMVMVSHGQSCHFHGWFPTYFVKMTHVLRLCFIEANTLDSAVVSVPLIVTILRKYTKSDLFLNFFWILPSMVACFWMMRRGSGMPNQWWHCSKMTQKMQLKLHSIQHLWKMISWFWPYCKTRSAWWYLWRWDWFSRQRWVPVCGTGQEWAPCRTREVPPGAASWCREWGMLLHHSCSRGRGTSRHLPDLRQTRWCSVGSLGYCPTSPFPHPHL